MSERTKKANLRMLWLLRKVIASPYGCVIAWEDTLVDDFVEAFPEAKKTLQVYLMGADVCPTLNRTAVRARDAGFLKPGSVGTTDARSFNQRTWARLWRITPQGREYVAMLEQDGH